MFVKKHKNQKYVSMSILTEITIARVSKQTSQPLFLFVCFSIHKFWLFKDCCNKSTKRTSLIEPTNLTQQTSILQNEKNSHVLGYPKTLKVVSLYIFLAL